MSTDPKEAAREILAVPDEALAYLTFDELLAKALHWKFEAKKIARALLAGPSPDVRKVLAPCDVEDLRVILARVKETEAFPIGGRDFDVLLSFIDAALSSPPPDEIKRLRASRDDLLAALEGCIAPVAWGVGDIPISEYPTIVDTKRALANARAAIARAKGEAT